MKKAGFRIKEREEIFLNSISDMGRGPYVFYGFGSFGAIIYLFDPASPYLLAMAVLLGVFAYLITVANLKQRGRRRYGFLFMAILAGAQTSFMKEVGSDPRHLIWFVEALCIGAAANGWLLMMTRRWIIRYCGLALVQN